MLIGDIVTGLVRCDALAMFGNASVQGVNLTYDNFLAINLYNETQGGQPLVDPTTRLTYYLFEEDSAEGAVLDAMGYAESSGNGGELYYTSPSLDGFANSMWNGIAQMTLAMDMLGRDTSTEQGIVQVTVSGRTRDQRYFIVTMCLLGSWLVSLVIATALMFRRTSCDKLGSYAAARLLAKRPDLFQGHDQGVMDDNDDLWESFQPVDDSARHSGSS